jgi:lysophospholipase L1-like esterase
MRHVVLLGDSIFDNAKYVPDGTSVIQHMQAALPEWQTTLLAVDGDVTKDVIGQTKLLPEDVTHLVVSVGGNDALQELNVLKQSVRTVADALLLFAEIRTAFKDNYREMLSHLLSFNLPITVCTIYTEFPVFGEVEKAALAMYNEIILSEASLHGLPIIDLRHICNQAEDYSEVSPIEPSSVGGEKIANAIASLLETHDFNLGFSVVIAAH